MGAGSGPALALGSGLAARAARPSLAGSVAKRLHMGWRSVRTGLSVVGGLIVLAVVVRAVWGSVDLHVDGGEKGGISIGTSGIAWKPGKRPWPKNTDSELFITSQVEQAEKPEGLSRMTLGFMPGEEELNAWSGTWRLDNGALKVTQGGSELGPKGRFLPRTYVAHRYFSSDDFTAEVEMDVHQLGPESAHVHVTAVDHRDAGDLFQRARRVGGDGLPDILGADAVADNRRQFPLDRHGLRSRDRSADLFEHVHRSARSAAGHHRGGLNHLPGYDFDALYCRFIEAFHGKPQLVCAGRQLETKNSVDVGIGFSRAPID
jgi:hypothetical protein